MKNIMHKLIIVVVILLLSVTFSLAKDEKGKTILYYRNPMNPSITSPTFMKDSMGMDYIPVYEEAEGGSAQRVALAAGSQTTVLQPEALVRISQVQQELIGVKTEAVIPRPLMRMIRTVAKIAYDPELYKAQTEFIQAYKTSVAIKINQNPEIAERLQAMVVASAFKLKLQGLSDGQIEELETKVNSDRSLLLSDALSPYVWAYLTIYEYDLGSIKTGDRVVLKAIAYPAEEFSGKIVAIDPVLDMNTRSVRARAQVDNPKGELKPNMYADAFIHIDLGEKLAVPKEAILDTGIRKIVYINLGKSQFKAQVVEVGTEAIAVLDGQERKFFPVINGLNENDIVVTTGNFLIDSQSQLSGGMSALWGSASEIKQEATQETGEVKTQHKH
jgi:membrane fusion protein, copper/silver efflux system